MSPTLPEQKELSGVQSVRVDPAENGDLIVTIRIRPDKDGAFYAPAVIGHSITGIPPNGSEPLRITWKDGSE